MKHFYYLIIFFTFPAISHALESSGTISFVSDYRYNGISQTKGEAAIQGSLDLSFSNGIYAGIWGSNVDYDDDAQLEIDYYVGYGSVLSNEIEYGAMLAYYTFPGYDTYDGEYGEAILTLGFKGLIGTYKYANDYFNTGSTAQYISLDYSHKIHQNINANIHAGHSFGDYWGEDDINDYQDYSMGLSTEFVGIQISIDYLFNDISSKDEISSGVSRNDDILLGTISKTF